MVLLLALVLGEVLVFSVVVVVAVFVDLSNVVVVEFDLFETVVVGIFVVVVIVEFVTEIE